MSHSFVSVTKLRFDVETLIIATTDERRKIIPPLRFDVETLIIATWYLINLLDVLLRFDVETLIIATGMVGCSLKPCCDN